MNRKYLFCFLLVIVILACFHPVLKSDFLNWDDDTYIMKHKIVTDFTPGKVSDIFLVKESVSSTYVPLTILNWSIDYSLFGLNSAVFHFENLLQHILICLLVFSIALQLGISSAAALVAALVFAIHPTRAEIVGWATARKDTLFTLFYLLSIFTYIKYVRQPRLLYFGLSLLTGILSVLAKPMALSLPLMLLLFDYLLGRKFELKLLIEKVPFFLLIEPIAWVTYSMNEHLMGFTWPGSILIWVWCAAFYIEKFFYPIGLSVVYDPLDPATFSNPAYIKSFIIVAAAIALVIYFRRNKWIVFAFGSYVITTFFLWRFDYSGVIAVVADRFLYVSSLGACLALGAGWEAVAKRLNQQSRWIWNFAVGLVIIGLMLLSSNQVKIWHDNITLWSDVIKKYPNVGFAYNNRGILYLLQKQYAAADHDLDMAILTLEKNMRQIKSKYGRLPAYLIANYARAFYYKGIILAKDNRYQEALTFFDKAIYFERGEGRYFNDRAITFRKLMKFDEAMVDYSMAIRLNPDLYEAFVNRGLLFIQKSDQTLALNDFLKAIKIDPQRPDAYLQAGRLYFEQADMIQAAHLFNEVLKIDPRNKRALYYLGLIHLKNGNAAEAQRYFLQSGPEDTKRVE